MKARSSQTGVMALLFCCLISACGSLQGPSATTVHRAEQDNLQWLSARARSSQLSAIRYDLQLIVHAEDAEFSGAVVIDFNVADNQSPLTIDFSGGTVDQITINGQRQPIVYNNAFITLEAGSYRVGANQARIAYRHPWNNVGEGLYRFQDPHDQRVYFYSQFEAYAANQVFPCFDQPDLKASFTLQVDAPANWEIISAERESHITHIDAGRRWQFPPTPPISTYAMSIHGGEFRIWEDPAASIPSRLFARQSIADRVPVSDWFKWTRDGFAFFGDWFGMDYPFNKYDQLLVPDFQGGAMENVGAVTFNERYVTRGELGPSQRQQIANVLFHEMAHMWFGNLVTMQWWNGLWLNESFATYMASLATTTLTEYDAWLDFALSDEMWGYFSDSLVTTHPVEVEIRDVLEASTMFDGISYGKGAAVIKQLVHRIGDEAFQNGLQAYMREHAWGNATLDDLMSALSDDQNANTGWINDWLLSAGTNTLTVKARCFNQLMSGVTVFQSAPESTPTLREHRLELAFYPADPETGLLVEPITVDNARSEGVVTALSPCPQFVFANHDDHGFVRLHFSDQDLRFLRRTQVQFADPLTHVQVWDSLWTMVHNGELPLGDFLSLLDASLEREQNMDVVGALNRYQRESYALIHNAWPHRDYPTDIARLTAAMGDKAWRRLREADWQTGEHLLWLDHVIAVSDSESALRQLRQLIDDPIGSIGWKPDQARRWRILETLAERAYPGTLARVEAEYRTDSSSEAALAIITINTLSRRDNETDRLLDELVTGSQRPMVEQQAMMRALFPASRSDLHRQYAEQIVNAIPEIDNAQPSHFSYRYIASVVPAFCDAASSAALEQILNRSPDLSPVAVNGLRQKQQENDRCIAIRALAMGDSAL